MTQTLLQVFIEPLLEMWKRFVSIVPNILVSLVFLLIGLSLARVASTLLQRFFKKIKLDDSTSKIGINEILARVGFGKSPAYALDFLVYWSVILVFVLLAANALNLDILTGLLERFIYFVPKLVVAIVVLFGGLLFARFAQQVVTNSVTANNLRGGEFLAKFVNIIIIVFASIMVLEQLGLEMVLIINTVQIAVAALGLAFALAVGLGSKELVADFLRNTFIKKQQ